jgi:hypothetical protein
MARGALRFVNDIELTDVGENSRLVESQEGGEKSVLGKSRPDEFGRQLPRRDRVIDRWE